MDQFYIFFSILLVFSVFMTISSYNPIHSVFWLVLVFLQSAILIISLSFEFLGLMLIIIYVGAIAILFLFVIMMLDIYQISKITNFNNIIPITFILLTHLIFINTQENIKEFININDWFFLKESQVLIIGKLVYNELGLLFMIISILLLIAMIGAIVLTLEINRITKRQYLGIQHHRNNSWV